MWFNVDYAWLPCNERIWMLDILFEYTSEHTHTQCCWHLCLLISLRCGNPKHPWLLAVHASLMLLLCFRMCLPCGFLLNYSGSSSYHLKTEEKKRSILSLLREALSTFAYLISYKASKQLNMYHFHTMMINTPAVSGLPNQFQMHGERESEREIPQKRDFFSNKNHCSMKTSHALGKLDPKLLVLSIFIPKIQKKRIITHFLISDFVHKWKMEKTYDGLWKAHSSATGCLAKKIDGHLMVSTMILECNDRKWTSFLSVQRSFSNYNRSFVPFFQRNIFDWRSWICSSGKK